MLEPRLNPDEVEYFKSTLSNIPAKTKMVEWGSGGSTLMFLDYFDHGELCSVEHSQEWHDKIVLELSANPHRNIKQFTYLFRPPLVDRRFYGYGVPHEENPCFAAQYINPEDDSIGVFDSDIYFVDGICRGAVLATIRAKATKAATVYLHDHHGVEQREDWYRWAVDLYGTKEKVGSTLLRMTL